MKAASLGYDDLHIETTGPEGAPPVVLLHGWGSSATLMRPIAQALEGAWRVYNVDLPGHGASPLPPEPWGVPEYAALVRDFLRHGVGAAAVLIGHSNGGRIALWLASDPEAAPFIRKLVLVSPSGVRARRSWKYYLRRAVAETLKAPVRLLPARLRPFANDWLRHTLVWQMLGSTDYRALHGVMRETFVRTVNCYVEDRLERVGVPVLLFWGDRDEAISRYQMSVLERRLPDAGLVVLPGAGHYGYLDAPGPFLDATRFFLQN